MEDKGVELTTTVADFDDERPESATRQRLRSKDYNRTIQVDFKERYISFLGIVNFGFTLLSGWECLGLSISLAFLNGGPSSLVYGTILSAGGNLSIALSLGEMASMDPTVGAQYRWSARFARKWPEFFGLMQGWITTFAWMVSAIGVLSLLSSSLQGMISFLDETYQPKAWHGNLIMWALLFLVVFFNLFLRKILNAFETLGGILHVLFFVAVITILATLGERTSTKYVFGTLTTGISGWTNPGICWNLGLWTVLVPLANYDSVLHMTDETKRPRERIPKAMIGSVLGNAVMLFGYIICLLFCMGDPEKVAMSPVPILEIFYQATKSKAVSVVVLMMHIFIQLIALCNVIASASRLIWAFAKDKGLPFHEFFSQVHPRLQIPLPALALDVFVVVLLSLINLGSGVALQALIAIPGIALNVSYFIPILLLLIRKLKGEHPRYGPFKLGSYGIPVNLVALCFTGYCTFWVSFPIAYPVVAETMNYAAPILIGLISLALLDWFTMGKKRFVIPVGQYNIEMEDQYNDGKNAYSEEAPSK